MSIPLVDSPLSHITLNALASLGESFMSLRISAVAEEPCTDLSYYWFAPVKPVVLTAVFDLDDDLLLFLVGELSLMPGPFHLVILGEGFVERDERIWISVSTVQLNSSLCWS